MIGIFHPNLQYNKIKQSMRVIMFDEIIAPLFTTEWGRRAGWAAMICMSLLLFWTLIATLYTWRSDFVLTHGQLAVASQLNSGDELGKLIDQIPSQHIFGQSGAKGPALPVTSLQLRLVGVIKA